MKNFKFIAQYNNTLYGSTNNGLKETIDVLLIDDVIYAYRRRSNGDFKLDKIERDSYNTHTNFNKFDGIIENPSSYIGMSLLIAIDLKHVSNPVYLQFEYYDHIYQLHTELKESTQIYPSVFY